MTDRWENDERYRSAFEIADELNVHGSGCVCPHCAGRLPGLLTQLAGALEQAERDAVR